jgi:putative transposase
VAAIIAAAVNIEGKREIVGLHIGPSEAETFWSGFLRSLAKRGLQGVKL